MYEFFDTNYFKYLNSFAANCILKINCEKIVYFGSKSRENHEFEHLDMKKHKFCQLEENKLQILPLYIKK